MPDGGRKAFWDRFDIHIKRWQSFFALIVALGTIIGFVGYKAGWHWPESWGAPSSPVVDNKAISTQIRYQSPEWQSRLTITSIDPILEVQIGYRNVGQTSAHDVVINLKYPEYASPLPGQATLKNAAHPDGLTVGDGATNGTGINIGGYTPR